MNKNQTNTKKTNKQKNKVRQFLRLTYPSATSPPQPVLLESSCPSRMSCRLSHERDERSPDPEPDLDVPSETTAAIFATKCHNVTNETHATRGGHHQLVYCRGI